MKNSKDNKLKAFIFFFWGREISGQDLTSKEAELLKIWEAEILNELDTEHLQYSKKSILSDIKRKSDSTSVISRHSVKKILKYAPAAVLLLFLSLFGVYNVFFKPDVYIADSSFKKVTLEDGTVVTLMQGAKLTVAKSFPADTRIVGLEGDAVFSVAKDKRHPFVVQAENFTTRVLGTVFKISQMGKDKSVELYEGKVAVSYGNTKDSYLMPNQIWTNFGIDGAAAVIIKKSDKHFNQPILKIKSLSFKDVPFIKVIEVIKKHYAIDILYPQEINAEKISAEFNGENVDDNIEMLAFAVGMQVHKENDKTYTLKK
ncbi:FecR family protein [Chryseobacterium sp.]|uniref:FecR family protein n=1 Tax=Chryseobacterium sp. TaxID=1871047 RepID=UPI002FCAD976